MTGIFDYFNKCWQAFEYVRANGGIDSESSYPYEGKAGPCRYSKKTRASTNIGETNLPEGDELELQKAVAEIGPISVAINAKYLSFYEKGNLFLFQSIARNLPNFFHSYFFDFNKQFRHFHAFKLLQ